MTPGNLAIEYLALDHLCPDERNPRRHDKRHVSQLAKSIEAFGFNAPILVDADNKIVAGHGRLAAAYFLGHERVPVVRLAHLTEQQRLGYLVADNRLNDLSSWNKNGLAAILLELAEADLTFELEAIGFSVGEIDLMTIDHNSDEDADQLPPDGPQVAKLGDLWTLGDHVVLCASALEPASMSALMNGDRADVVFTDPPFNVPIRGHVSGLGKIQHEEFAQACGEMTDAEFTAFLISAMQNCAAVSRDGSIHYWAMDWRHLYHLETAAREVYDEQVNLAVWAKTNAGMGSFLRSQHELFGIWRKGRISHRNNVQLGRFGRHRTNVWTYPGANSFGRGSDEGNLLALHPTVKPVALIADALLDSTKRRDIVLDPFLGSGSTLIAAEKIGRRCRGIEISPTYVDTIIRRWQRWSGGTARRGDGALFDELASVAHE